MPASEFALIERYFQSLGATRADVVLGVGDDGAVVAEPAGSTVISAITKPRIQSIDVRRWFTRRLRPGRVERRSAA